jgi:multimeric flavodoxin WrbA
MNHRALILDGQIDDDAMAETSLAIATAWLEARQWEITTLRLCDLEIAPCVGCFGCWVKTPGECVIDDAGRDVARRIVQSDLVVYLTPIQFGGYSYELKKAIDRSIPIILPYFRKVQGEVHHKKRYDCYPSIAAIGWGHDPATDEGELFETLVHRNGINLFAPKTAVGLLAPGDVERNERRVEWALTEATET